MPLSAALAHVVGNGISEDQAKRGICNALNDRVIGVRMTIAGKMYGADELRNVRVAPEDLDWEDSGQTWFDSSVDELRTSLIELLIADVEQVFGNTKRRLSRIDVERKAVGVLKQILQRDGEITRDAAFAKCRKELPSLARKQFRRVWPDARVEAGLPKEAPRGPRKSIR
jgi:hypothetical protein